MSGQSAAGAPKVSVIIPIYKVEKYLVPCIESVLRQTLEELEIILLDEGDQDRCREIIDFYEQADSRVVAVHEPNPGASYGAKVNRGLDMARGEFVAIVEPDDFIGQEMYEQMYACAVRTGANIVKTPFYNYVNKQENEVDKSRGYINRTTPKEKPFSIFQFPDLLAVHPSIWSALYRTEELRRQGVRCVEAPKAGYVDNGFYVDAYVKLGKIVWLNKPFYRWRTSSETSSSSAANWDRAAMLARWNEILDKYPPDAEQYKALVPGFANKAYASVFRHYLDGWTFDQQEYGQLTAFLGRFTQEQLQAAFRVPEAGREQMLLCRNEPERFRQKYFPEPEEQEQAQPASGARKRDWLEDGRVRLGAFQWAVCFLLLGIGLKTGVFGALLSQQVSAVCAAVCAVCAAVCIPVMALCAAAEARAKRRAGDKKRQS